MKEIELISGERLVFKPYEGYFIIDSKGNSRKLESIENSGPLKEVVEVLSHGNYHTLYNLLDLTGNKIFDKGVRSIKFIKRGYYIVEDNNEDDLKNLNGCIKSDEYWEKQCVVLSNGEILSNKWYDRVSPLPNDYVKVWKENKENILSLGGELYLKEYVDFVTYFNGEYACYIKDNVIYKQYKDGTIDRIRDLFNFPDIGKYYISGGIKIENGEVVGSQRRVSDVRLDCNHAVYRVTEEPNIHSCNLLSKNAKVVFRKWYDQIEFSGINGLYYVKQSGKWNIVDITEKKIGDTDFLRIIPYQDGFAVAKKLDGTYCIIDLLGNIVAGGFNSVLRIPREGIWEVDFFSLSEKTFLCGQGGDFIFMVQGLLVETQWIGLFKKENIWYYLDENLQMKPLFKYDFAVETSNAESSTCV